MNGNIISADARGRWCNLEEQTLAHLESVSAGQVSLLFIESPNVTYLFPATKDIE